MTTSKSDAQIAASIKQTKAALSDAAKEVRNATRTLTDNMVEKVKDQSQEIQRVVTTYVKKKPLAALGGAILAGITLAFIFRRRR